MATRYTRQAVARKRPLLAALNDRKPPRKGQTSDTLLKLVAPKPIGAAPAKGHILDAQNESPKACGHRHGKWLA